MKRVKHETQMTPSPPSQALRGTEWQCIPRVPIATNEMNTKASMCASFKRKQGLRDE